MNSDSIKSDFLAARSKTAVTIMNATGWNSGVVNPEVISGDAIFFYVFEFKSKWIWSCSVPREAFYLVAKEAGSVARADAISQCGRLIDLCAANVSLDPEKENALAFALTAYINITKSYQLSERATKANHFFVIRYGQTDTLRPFAMGGPAGHLIAADEAKAAIAQVITMDSKNHPEWLSK